MASLLGSKSLLTWSLPAEGRHDDIFASESEDEGQQGKYSEAEDEDEEDEFEALFKTGKKKKRKGQAQEVRFVLRLLNPFKCIGSFQPPNVRGPEII